jgi:predicted ATPase/class 3 adenylate cyclase
MVAGTRGRARTTTFVFTDIEGSTRQWEEAPEMRIRVEHHFAALRRAVAAHDGEVFATMGDGIAAAFASAEAAVAAAVDGQRAMAGIGLAVRMGIHTGEVERADDDFRGRPVNRAARLTALGHGGQILVSDVAAALLRGGPSPVELVDLGTRYLRDLDDPERIWQVVHPDLDGRFPPLRGLGRCADNLPVPRSSMVGRDRDVARVISLLQQHRIVTLTGVGGVGKTRLGLQAAAELLPRCCRVWFVELASVTEADDVVDAVALTVGAAAVTEPLAAATALLGGERTLLVLDNCEHVIDSVAAVVDWLTAECPRLSVIATSREALGIDGEHVVPVRPLDPATTAADLFRQRASAAGAELGPDAAPAIEQLCRRLDGIPLAIELAAARAATVGLAAIVDALDDRLSVLGGGRRRAVDRHGTMRATIDWSYRLLDEPEQRLVERLAVFPNGFEIDAAQHVAGTLGIGTLAAIEHVASLVQKSMVVAEPFGEGPATTVRHRMLETVRAFALERLDERGERLAALRALAEWVAMITDLPWDEPCSAAVERNAIRLEREADAWREATMVATASALGSAEAGDLAARLCGPPVAFFLLGRHDLADLVRPLLPLCGDDPLRRRAVLCALMVSAGGATPAEQMQAWADEQQAIDDGAVAGAAGGAVAGAAGGAVAGVGTPTGLGGLMRWLASAWRGDFAASVEICAAASLDPRIGRSTRDLFVGIATLDRFSLTDARDDPHGLIGRALEVAERSDVAMHRVTCLLGAAWGLHETEPGRSLELVRRALDDIADLPALTRLTLPGGASRLLARLDPRIAAQGLLEQLDTADTGRADGARGAGGGSFVDLIPVSYATALLHRLDHPTAASALAALTVPSGAPYLSMMDSVDLARRAVAVGDLGSLDELTATVRTALREIVEAPGEPELADSGRRG